jgi:hypothetical protein
MDERRLDGRALIGLLLILVGGVFLIDNFIPTFDFGGLFWAVLFGLGGLVFLGIFLSNREQWWALIPGFVLLGLGLVIFFGEFAPGRLDDLGGAIFLGMIGVAFLAVYLVRREQWWAIIPAGVMFTVASIAALSALGWDENNLASGGLLFFGIGLTFALVALLPGPKGRMTWAWIPAGILLSMGFLMTFSSMELMQYIWPVALIVVGLGIISRSFLRR